MIAYQLSIVPDGFLNKRNINCLLKQHKAWWFVIYFTSYQKYNMDNSPYRNI